MPALVLEELMMYGLKPVPFKPSYYQRWRSGREASGVKRLKARWAYNHLISKRIWLPIVLPKIYLELPTLNT
jgi:hypothetical protein